MSYESQDNSSLFLILKIGRSVYIRHRTIYHLRRSSTIVVYEHSVIPPLCLYRLLPEKFSKNYGFNMSSCMEDHRLIHRKYLS